MATVEKVKALSNFRLAVLFKDGTKKTVDVAPFLRGPVYAPLRDPRRFRKARVNPLYGCVEWPNGADLSPDLLYYGGLPPWLRKKEHRSARRRTLNRSGKAT